MAEQKKTFKKLTFKVAEFGGETMGIFDWGKGRDEIFNRYRAIEKIDDPEQMMSQLQKLIDEDPEFIDAYNRLGWWEYALHNFGNAISLFYFAYEIGSKTIPIDFQGKIDWGFLENRPFLSTMEGLAQSLLSVGHHEDAIELCEEMLRYNPADNQAIRALIIENYLHIGDYKNILKICKMFTDDILPDTLYGKFIAHYRLNDLDKARDSLKNAYVYAPNIAHEVIKKKHRHVKDELLTVTIAGSAEEAIDYWNRTRHIWNEPGIVSYVKSNLDL